MRFYIADTHFGHANIIKYCGRPYESTEEMNLALIENWNSVVTDEDEVYILGDFAMGGAEKIANFAKQLNGKKYLVQGNHDRPKYFTYSGITVITTRTITTHFNGKKYILRHHPPDLHDTKHVIFGHIHDNGIGDPRCVSVENINYTPISHDELEKRLAE